MTYHLRNFLILFTALLASLLQCFAFLIWTGVSREIVDVIRRSAILKTKNWHVTSDVTFAAYAREKLPAIFLTPGRETRREIT